MNGFATKVTEVNWTGPLTKLPVVVPSPLLIVFDFMCVIALLAVLWAWLHVVRQRTDNRMVFLAQLLFGLYLVGLLAVVFLPLHGFRSAAAAFQGTQPLARAWQWGTQLEVPWSNGRLEWQRVANVLLTLPFGFGIALFLPRIGLRRLSAICLATALSLEFGQLGVSVLIGITYRTFDVNDIVDNAVGAFLGLALFAVTSRIMVRFDLGVDQPPTRALGYVRQAVDDFLDTRHDRHTVGSER